METLFALAIILSLIAVLAQRFGVDTRPGVNDRPERWVGHRSHT
jgi:hypothetical protein